MTVQRLLRFTTLLAALTSLVGCRTPGKPLPGSTPLRPDQISDFNTLYASNCAACHGVAGHKGMAVSLANPAYIAYAGEQNIADITAKGIAGSLMPAFAKSYGGLLTDQQVRILAHGIITRWANPSALHGSTPPPYQSQTPGDPSHGAQLYQSACATCHAPAPGSLLDPTYLSLISSGGLRTLIIAGKPEQGMPDWQDLKTGPLTSRDVDDLVAFLDSHRTPSPGQPFPNRQGAFPAAAPAAQPADPLAPPQSQKESQR